MEIIREVAIFLIVVNILSSLMPNDNYKKYLKVLSGLILILIIIEPLHVFFDNYELENVVNKNIKESDIVELNKSMAGVNEEIGKGAKKIYEDEIEESLYTFLKDNDIETEEIKVELEIDEESALVPAEIYIKTTENNISAWEENYAMETRALYVKQLISKEYEVDKELIIVE